MYIGPWQEMRLAQRLAAVKTLEESRPKKKTPLIAESKDYHGNESPKIWQEIPEIFKDTGKSKGNERSWKSVTKGSDQQKNATSKGRSLEITRQRASTKSYSRFISSLANDDKSSFQNRLPLLECSKTLGSVFYNSGENKPHKANRKQIQKVVPGQARKLNIQTDHISISHYNPDGLKRYQRRHKKKLPTSLYVATGNPKSRPDFPGNYDSKLLCKLLQTESTTTSMNDESPDISSFWKWRSKRKGPKRKTEQVEMMRKSYLKNILTSNDQPAQVKSSSQPKFEESKINSNQRIAKKPMTNDMELTRSDFDQVRKHFQNFCVDEHNKEDFLFPSHDLDPLKIVEDYLEDNLLNWAANLESLSEDGNTFTS